MLTDDEKMEIYVQIFEAVSYLIEEGRAAADRRRFSLAYSANDPNVAAIYLLKQENRLLSEKIRKQAEELKTPRGEPVQREKEEVIREKREEEKAVKSAAFNFSEKEINAMPKLKDCKMRYREKDGIYEIRFRQMGFNMSWSSKDPAVAMQKCRQWIRTLNVQIKTTVERKKTNDSLFRDFADYYMMNVKKKMVKPATFYTYYNHYKLHILPIYGNKKLKEITPLLIQEHLDKLNAKTPRACEDVKILLNSILEYAVNSGLIPRNPVKVVYVEKHERITGQALTKEEEAELLEVLKGRKIELCYILALYTGARRCEVCSAQFDLEKNTITFKNGKLKSYQKQKFRTVPIFPKLKPYIERFISESWRTSEDRITHTIREIFPNGGHSFKDLRHTFTTRARECGIDNEVVSLWTGHSLGNITASVYTHFSDEFMQEQAKKLVY